MMRCMEDNGKTTCLTPPFKKVAALSLSMNAPADPTTNLAPALSHRISSGSLMPKTVIGFSPKRRALESSTSGSMMLPLTMNTVGHKHVGHVISDDQRIVGCNQLNIVSLQCRSGHQSANPSKSINSDLDLPHDPGSKKVRVAK